MESFVIDTNFFVNQEIQTGFGKTTLEVSKGFIEAAEKAKKNTLFFMPPSISSELQDFVIDLNIWKKLISVFTVKAPNVNSINIPAHIWLSYVCETRERMFRGMKIGEEKIKDAGMFFIGKENMDKIGFEKNTGPIITNFRERYRNATRFQFIDSVADFDLILLAYETKSHIVSSDEGVIRWARMLGVKEQPPVAFQQKLLTLASPHL